ncbi:MAG: hypothetical protein KDK78_12540, partial [Chlamydiia bacterium]|nr:hypothetical protein [Chlamydiia bacterium]
MKRILKMAIALACLGGQMDATVTVFRGGQVLRDHVLEEMELWIEGDRIIEARAHADRVVDASGQILAPGYIDVQINGAFGCDFSSNPEHIAQVSQQLFQTGCTGFVPTLVTSDAATYAEVLPFLKGALGGMVLGFHLEGPFIAMERKGAHDSMHVQCQDASPDRLQEIYGDLGAVRLVTLAPEIPGALDAIRHLVAQGVVVSIGHSSAD